MRGRLKFVGACVLSLSLAVSGSGADGVRGASSGWAFTPKTTKGAVAVFAVNLDKEQAFKVVDAAFRRTVRTYGLKDEQVQGVARAIAGYKRDLLKDMPQDMRTFLEESGLSAGEYRWAVLSLDGFRLEDGEPRVEGLALAVAAKIDLERFLAHVQKDMSEDPENAVEFKETSVEGVKAWRMVPQTKECAKSLEVDKLDPYVALLDGQLVLAAQSRETLVKQIRLYRRGEGEGDMLRGFSPEGGDFMRMIVTGYGDILRQCTDPEDWEGLTKVLPNGDNIFLNMKTLAFNIGGKMDGSTPVSFWLQMASEKDADALRTLMNTLKMLARAHMAQDSAHPKDVVKMFDDVRIGGTGTWFEMSIEHPLIVFGALLESSMGQVLGDLKKPEGSKAKDAPKDKDVPKAKDAPKDKDAPKAKDAPKDKDAPKAKDAPKDKDAPKAKVGRAKGRGTPSKELVCLMAGVYAQKGQVDKSRKMYEAMLAENSCDHGALIGLWRLSLQEGDFDKAKEYLLQAAMIPKSMVPKETAPIRFESVLLFLMNNNLEGARRELEKLTDLHPHSLPAWALLAGVVLQQADKVWGDQFRRKIFAEVENVILPRMERAAESPNDFYVQFVRALVLLRKGSAEENLKEARDAFQRAWASRPVVRVGEMVLGLDYRLLDKESAERHAREILRLDDRHPFANWVMGSIRLMDGNLPEAERYLRTSVGASRPPAAAQNDLAELLRQSGRPAEAEKYARAATQTDPGLGIAWDTLCAALLDQDKNLAEAEKCIQRAMELDGGKDIRLRLTLARVQIAKRDFAKARITIRSLDRCRDELSAGDRAVLDKLQKQVQPE